MIRTITSIDRSTYTVTCTNDCITISRTFGHGFMRSIIDLYNEMPVTELDLKVWQSCEIMIINAVCNN